VQDALTQLVPRVGDEAADFVAIALGVNDILRFTPLRQWSRRLNQLTDALLARTGAQRAAWLAAPPLAHFPALPAPLNHIAGHRGRRLNARSAEAASLHQDVTFVPFPAFTQGPYFAADGFHPSKQGYAAWAEYVAEQVSL
jgi:lysophospholipase L1-like esterase